MAQVHKCNLCGKVTEGMGIYINKDYCRSCEDRLIGMELDIREKIRETMNQWYKKGTDNSAAIVEFCDYILKNHSGEFIEDYGSKAWQLLLRVVG